MYACMHVLIIINNTGVMMHASMEWQLHHSIETVNWLSHH